MSRPKIRKFVCDEPRFTKFVAEGQCDNAVVELSCEEYECVRLIDQQDMSQEECAVQMRVSRPTVQILYATARKKIADSLVNGKALHIGGGTYTLCDDTSVNCMHKNKCNYCIKQR